MLVIKVELWPGGDETRRTELGRMVIGNISEPGADGRLPEISKYIVAATEASNALTLDGPREIRFTLDKHNRRQTVWSIVARAAMGVTDRVRGRKK